MRLISWLTFAFADGLIYRVQCLCSDGEFVLSVDLVLLLTVYSVDRRIRSRVILARVHFLLVLMAASLSVDMSLLTLLLLGCF